MDQVSTCINLFNPLWLGVKKLVTWLTKVPMTKVFEVKFEHRQSGSWVLTFSYWLYTSHFWSVINNHMTSDGVPFMWTEMFHVSMNLWKDDLFLMMSQSRLSSTALFYSKMLWKWVQRGKVQTGHTLSLSPPRKEGMGFKGENTSKNYKKKSCWILIIWVQWFLSEET